MSTEHMMWAARIRGPERVTLERTPIPEPGPRDVVFRVRGTGVCGSNLGPWLGAPGVRYPLAPGESGHEGWGVVHAVGRDVRAFSVGDAIAAVSNGAYAQYDVAPEDAIVPLPPSLADGPFPAQPMACALNAFERAGITAGHTVAVVGVGFLGALLVRLAVMRGARVFAISRRSTALHVARELGAEVILPLEDDREVIAQVGELTGGHFCDRVLEATGRQKPLDLAAELTRIRGRLVIAGYHQDGPRTVNMQLWNHRGIDVVNAHERDVAHYVRGMRAAVGTVTSRMLAPERLYTHVYALDGLADALTATAERPRGFMKALVLP